MNDLTPTTPPFLLRVLVFRVCVVYVCVYVIVLLAAGDATFSADSWIISHSRCVSVLCSSCYAKLRTTTARRCCGNGDRLHCIFGVRVDTINRIYIDSPEKTCSGHVSTHAHTQGFRVSLSLSLFLTSVVNLCRCVRIWWIRCLFGLCEFENVYSGKWYAPALEQSQLCVFFYRSGVANRGVVEDSSQLVILRMDSSACVGLSVLEREDVGRVATKTQLETDATFRSEDAMETEYAYADNSFLSHSICNQIATELFIFIRFERLYFLANCSIHKWCSRILNTLYK